MNVARVHRTQFFVPLGPTLANNEDPNTISSVSTLDDSQKNLQGLDLLKVGNLDLRLIKLYKWTIPFLVYKADGLSSEYSIVRYSIV